MVRRRQDADPQFNTHGTGCTLSSALATHLTRGQELNAAVAADKACVTHTIVHADDLSVGSGHGPNHHLLPSMRGSRNPRHELSFDDRHNGLRHRASGPRWNNAFAGLLHNPLA
ncbi:bifunctional hydroxymethylpyrimidine kinase/phosphomethylpyrimidine kinase [uncultured Tateyamaria sp.]|uniref:bifunctional hydroxymethylpyrimidine kinase/phosphomethylpyrimidine kinase n=1 Tax=uncultured Tateyamaria sp. TaxID=455651 RepID=UPI002608C8B3|nr:bifunctional hydroxymethylpyrimidine kinase/phosphomethylpyrimidine kinase [uncultured Tateyamaria sp.]